MGLLRPAPAPVRVAFGALAAVLAADVALLLAGAGGVSLFRLNLANVVEFGATALVLARVLVVREGRASWVPLAAGMVSYSLGFILYAEIVERQHPIPYPSIADGFWLAIYPCLYLTMGFLLWGRIGTRDPGLWLDGLVAALAVTALGSTFLFEPVLHQGTGGSAGVLTNLAYPLSDVALLAFLAVALVLTGGGPTRMWALVGAGLAIFAIADSVYVSLATTGSYHTGGLLDAGWPIGLLLLAAASWQQAPVESAPGGRGLQRLVLALPAGAIALAVLVAGALGLVNTPAVALAAATVACSLARTAHAVLLEARLDETLVQAMTDDLTGLANRRQLLEDLGQALDTASARRPGALVLFDLDGFKHYNDTFGHLAGDTLLAQLARRLATAVGERGRAYRLGGDEFCALVWGDPRALDELLPELEAALSDDTAGLRIGCSYGVALLPQEGPDASSALAIADRRMYVRKDAERRSTRLQMRDLLLAVVEEQHPDLHGHSSDVSNLCREVGGRLEIPHADLDLLVLAAQLHDIGKVAIPETIVGKPGALDEVEWELMRRHTLIGQRILETVPALVPVARIVRATHERWEGGGYPDGLRGEDIPLGARVIAVCDAFDAMVTNRPYRSALSRLEAEEELRRNAGTQFDPLIVDALLSVLAEDAAPRTRPRALRLAPPEPQLSAIASLRGLLEITRLARRAESLDRVLDAIARTVAQSLGLGIVVINLRRAGSDVFDVATVHGSDEVRSGLLGSTTLWSEWEPLLDERFHRRGAYHIRAGEYDWATLEGKRVVVGRAIGDDPSLWHPEDELFVPFYSSDRRLLGIFSVGEPSSRRRPSDDEVDVLVAMAEHAADVVESVQGSERISELAHIGGGLATS